MNNPYKVLDLSDDEGAEVKKVEVTKPAKPSSTAAPGHRPTRNDLKKEEEDLKQKKKGPGGSRGQIPQPNDVTTPKERSKIGLKKEEHVNTHKAEGDQAPRRGRQFDRHSGTGRGREIKKGGAGTHNWGKAGDELAGAPKTPEPTAEGVAGEAKPEETPVVVEEKEVGMTLEEYEKQRALKRSGAAFAVKEARKVETEVVGKVYKKDEDVGEGDYIKLGEEHDLKKKPAHFKVKPTKQALELNFTIRDTSQDVPSRGRGGDRSSGDRGGANPRSEGGGRGGGSSRGRGAPRGRGQPRNPSEKSAGKVDTTDQSAFPKLGGTTA